MKVLIFRNSVIGPIWFKMYTYSKANTAHLMKAEIQNSKSPSPEEPNGEDEGVGGWGVERVDQDNLGEDGVVQPVGALGGKSEPVAQQIRNRHLREMRASAANLFYLE